jgi:hypothetical protein
VFARSFGTAPAKRADLFHTTRITLDDRQVASSFHDQCFRSSRHCMSSANVLMDRKMSVQGE